MLDAWRRLDPLRRARGGLGITEAAARVAVHRWQRRYRELLRQKLAQTLSQPARVDEELRALFGAVTA